MSHYSAVLREQCNLQHPTPESHDYRITVDVDPVIFDLFVEWMYYGRYTLDDEASQSIQNTHVSFATQAWALGNALKATGFRRYAMDRLYQYHVEDATPDPVTPADVRYACIHSAAGSGLRLLFFDIVADHFEDSRRVLGSAEEWDVIMQEQPELRMQHLRAQRSGISPPGQRRSYMDVQEGWETADAARKEAGRIVPAKRDANGVAVKKEPVDEQEAPGQTRSETYSLLSRPPWRRN